MASSGETVHPQLAAVAESVNSNDSSAVADAGDTVASSAVAVSQSSPPPTRRCPIRLPQEDGEPPSQERNIIDNEYDSVPVSTGQQIIVAGQVIVVEGPTPKTRQLDVMPPTQTTAALVAVSNAVHAAGGTAAGAEPTIVEASPPSTAVAGNAAGASSAVAESAPAAPVVEDATTATQKITPK